MKILGGTLLAATAIVLLAGCAPTTAPTSQASTPIASPTATPTAAPAASIVISGSNLVIADAAGTAIQTIPFSSDSAAAIDAISDAVGSTPVTSETPGGQACDPSHSEARWGTALMVSWGDDLSRAEGANFVVTASEATVGGIALETPTGFSVGESSKDLIAAVPGTEGFANGNKTNGWTDVYYDPTAGSKDDPDHWAGAFASGKADMGDITALVSPVGYTAFINACS